MSLDAMDWVWEHSQSKGVGRLVLLAIADKAMPSRPDEPSDCKAYASLTFLQKRANCTREAVTAALAVMYAAGELELVPGEKGPYGAAVYRLPKAIGYVREPRTERPAGRSGTEIGRLTRPIGAEDQSAHPTNPARDSQGIGRLSRPGVVGSADQLNAESVGSADHTTSSSPTNPPPPADPSQSAPPGREGGGTAAQQDHQAAYDALARITAKDPRLTLGEHELHQLAPLATPWLQRTTPTQMETALTAGLPPAVGSPAGLLRKRLIAKLPPPPQATEEQRCGRPNCNPSTHMLTLPNGDVDYCDVCHPTGRARARRQQGASA